MLIVSSHLEGGSENHDVPSGLDPGLSVNLHIVIINMHYCHQQRKCDCTWTGTSLFMCILIWLPCTILMAALSPLWIWPRCTTPAPQDTSVMEAPSEFKIFKM